MLHDLGKNVANVACLAQERCRIFVNLSAALTYKVSEKLSTNFT